MKINKIIGGLVCATPLLTVPLSLTSCAIYTNCLNDFNPSFSQLTPATYTYADGINQWFNKGKNINDFVKQEILWCNSKAAKCVDEGSAEIPHYTYKSTFSSYNVNVGYANITNIDEHRLSFKINTDIETSDIYSYDGVPTGSGKSHYQVEWSCSNLRFDAIKETNISEGVSKDYWLIKPVVYDGNETWWATEDFDEKETISFNVKYIFEIYKDGIQKYGLEATEAATMGKGYSYQATLHNILNYFCCFWSYSLDKCSFGE